MNDVDTIDKGIYSKNIDPYKAEMFTIGMTVLEASTLENCSYLYTRNPLKINN